MRIELIVSLCCASAFGCSDDPGRDGDAGPPVDGGPPPVDAFAPPPEDGGLPDAGGEPDAGPPPGSLVASGVCPRAAEARSVAPSPLGERVAYVACDESGVATLRVAELFGDERWVLDVVDPDVSIGFTPNDLYVVWTGESGTALQLVDDDTRAIGLSSLPAEDLEFVETSMGLRAVVMGRRGAYRILSVADEAGGALFGDQRALLDGADLSGLFLSRDRRSAFVGITSTFLRVPLGGEEWTSLAFAPEDGALWAVDTDETDAFLFSEGRIARHSLEEGEDPTILGDGVPEDPDSFFLLRGDAVFLSGGRIVAVDPADVPRILRDARDATHLRRPAGSETFLYAAAEEIGLVSIDGGPRVIGGAPAEPFDVAFGGDGSVVAARTTGGVVLASLVDPAREVVTVETELRDGSLVFDGAGLGAYWITPEGEMQRGSLFRGTEVVASGVDAVWPIPSSTRVLFALTHDDGRRELRLTEPVE